MESLIVPKVDYAIYPSLLDAYLRFDRKDDDETLISLLEKINKVKSEQTEQQLRGIAFENCVDMVIDGLKADVSFGPVRNGDLYVSNGFEFKAQLVDKIAFKLQHATKRQEYVEAIFPSHVGTIKLYGKTDYSFPNMISDLKTTENYKCQKYEDHAQHPGYSLIKKLNGNPLQAFKYVVTDFNRDYQETYIPTEKMHYKLLQTIFEFTAFLNHFEKYITHRAVFGE